MSRRLMTTSLAGALTAAFGFSPGMAQVVPKSKVELAIADAAEAIDDGRYAEAIDTLNPVVESSDNPAVRFYLADALLRDGRAEEASRMLVKFYGSFGRTPEPERYKVLVGLSASLADRLYGWEQVTPPESQEDGMRDALWGGLITSGVAAVALGAVATVAAVQGSEIELDSTEADPGAEADAVSWDTTLRVAGVGAAISAAVAIGCGIGLAVTADGDTDVQISPRVGPEGTLTGAAASFSLRF